MCWLLGFISKLIGIFTILQWPIFNHMRPCLQRNIPVAVIGDIQSLLVMAMCNIANFYFGKKSPGLGAPESTEQNEQCYFVDASIAFCKLQQLNCNLPIKLQVSCATVVNFCLIVALFVSLSNLSFNYF